MAAEPEIIERLDQIQATLKIAFAAQIAEFRERIRADKVNAAILDAAGDWISSAELQEKVAVEVSMSTRSVRDRFPHLIAEGVLQMRGAESRPEYRVTGLI
jgi:hypothetical protein